MQSLSEKAIKKLRNSYCLTMLLHFVIIFISGCIYFILFIIFNPTQNIMGKEGFLASVLYQIFWSIIMNLIVSFLLFQIIKKSLKNIVSQEIIYKKINQLIFFSLIWISLLGLAYASVNIYFTFSELKSYFTGNIFEYFDYISTLLYYDFILPIYLMALLLNNYTTKFKIILFEEINIILNIKKKYFWKELLLTFFVIAVYPIIILTITFISAGYFDKFHQNPNNIFFLGNIIIVFLGLALTIVLSTKIISNPVSLLIDAIRKVSKGFYDVKTPVISDNELGELAINFNTMTKGLLEKERIKNTFGKYVTPEIANEILTENLKLGGEEKTVTFMFTDIENYTSISEKMNPVEIVKLLNEYFSMLVDIITKYKGIVNKFIGDSVFAMYNIPLEDKNHSSNAILSALEIQKVTKDYLFLDKIRINTRIGINTGIAIVGNIGSKDRLEYTAIGDAVNVAQRLEAHNKILSTNILIAETTYQEAKSNIPYLKEMGYINVKGRDESVNVYSINSDKVI